VDDKEKLVQTAEGFEEIYYREYYGMMGNKLGLDEVNQNDVELINEFETVLGSVQPDMTIFYQLLIELPITVNDEELINHFKSCLYSDLSAPDILAVAKLLTKYQSRIQKNTCSRESAVTRMQKNNPRFILRNYLLHQAIEELEKGKDDLFKKLQEAIKDPYSKEYDEFFVIRPNWATQMAGCSMLSCSS
jgi:uncharacterized protein YdiU (UPF0061 family)